MHRSQVRILLCSENKDLINSFVKKLSEKEYKNISKITNLLSVLSVIEEQRPHVLILDYAINGAVELITKADIPILILNDKNDIKKKSIQSEFAVIGVNSEADVIDLSIENLYYKNRLQKEVRRTENKEQKVNQKLLKELRQVAFYEQQLLRSKQMYYSSLNALDDSIFVIDTDLNIVLENKAFKQFKKHMHIDTSTLGDSVDALCKHLNGFSMAEYILMMKTGEELKAETIQLSNNFTGEVTKKPIFDEDETVTRVITVIKDVTDKYKNEQKIKEQTIALKDNLTSQKLVSKISLALNTLEDFDRKINTLLQVIGKNFDSSRVFIYSKNYEIDSIEYTHEWCNRKIPSQIEKKVIIPCDELLEMRKIFEEHEHYSHNKAQNISSTLKSKLYAEDVTSLLLFPLFSTDDISGILGLDECVANRSWTDQEIELLKTLSGILSKGFQMRDMMNNIIENEEKTSAIVHAIPDMLYQLNINGSFQTIKYDSGSRLEKIQTDVKGKNIRDMFSPETASKLLQAIYKCIYKDESAVEFDIEVINRENNYEARFEKINDKEVIAIVRNITKQKRYEQKLNDAKEQAVKANKSKDRLFSIISHDIKHPLADLKSLLDLLIYDVDRFSKENLKRCFEEIKETTDATFNLLQDLLQWSRKEMNRIEYEPVEFSLEEIVSKNLELYKQGAAKKGIELTLKGKMQVNVFADRNMLDTTLRNLITNAIKFSNRDSEIIIHIEQQEKMMQLAVQDFGVGIPEEHRDKILNKADIITTRGTANEKGTGVGLDLCRDFVEMNKGKLWFETEVGKGTTFFFTLPQKAD